MTDEMKENILNYWLCAVSCTACRLPCADCRDLLGSGCPLDIQISKEKTFEFIGAVTSMLRKHLEELDNIPFGPTFIEESDFMRILTEAANE